MMRCIVVGAMGRGVPKAKLILENGGTHGLVVVNTWFQSMQNTEEDKDSWALR